MNFISFTRQAHKVGRGSRSRKRLARGSKDRRARLYERTWRDRLKTIRLEISGCVRLTVYRVNEGGNGFREIARDGWGGFTSPGLLRKTVRYSKIESVLDEGAEFIRKDSVER